MRKTVKRLGQRGWLPQYSLILALLIQDVTPDVSQS